MMGSCIMSRLGLAGEGQGAVDRRVRPSGFSMLELVVTLAIVLIASAMAIPVVKGVIGQYQVNAAVQSVTGIIQATRYRAIASGYPYRIVFNKANYTYQVQSDPNNNGAFANVGGAVPFSTASAKPVINADLTLQFRGNGAVSTALGALPLTLTMKGQTKTISVGIYGNITVQ